MENREDYLSFAQATIETDLTGEKTAEAIRLCTDVAFDKKGSGRNRVRFTAWLDQRFSAKWNDVRQHALALASALLYETNKLRSGPVAWLKNCDVIRPCLKKKIPRADDWDMMIEEQKKIAKTVIPHE